MCIVHGRLNIEIYFGVYCATHRSLRVGVRVDHYKVVFDMHNVYECVRMSMCIEHMHICVYVYKSE